MGYQKRQNLSHMAYWFLLLDNCDQKRQVRKAVYVYLRAWDPKWYFDERPDELKG
jgi:hypothetical protein